MQPFFDEIKDRNGRAIRGATVTVLNADEQPATIYSDNGVRIQANPVPANDDGEVSFYAPNGRYTLIYEAPGSVGESREWVAYDHADDESMMDITQYGVSTPTTAQALLRGETATVPAARGFWPNVGAGANVHRLKDRLMVGDGADSTGTMTDTQGGAVINSADGANWAPRDSVGFFASRKGLMALTGFAVNDDMDTSAGRPGETIGTSGFVINRLAARKTWGLYSDVQHESASGSSYGLEVALKNKAENNSSTPYYNPPGTFGVWLAAGGDPSYGGSPANPCDTGITLVKNGSTWNKGLVFKANALTGTDGTTGTGNAIEMARGHQVRWLTPANGTGAILRSDVSTNGRGPQMVFGDGGFSVLSLAGTETWLSMFADASAANGVRIRARTTGLPALMEAIGETNSALELRSQGTGSIGMAPGGVTQAQFSANSGATDWWEFKGGASASGGVQCNAQGADSDIPMVFSAKGSGYFRYFTGGAFGAEQFRILHAASAVNMLAVIGAASGSSPTLSATGAGTDIDINLRPRGTGVVSFGTHTAAADEPITGYITIKDASGNLRKLAVIG